MTDDPVRAKVNALYWESDASVAAIADRLGISRRALYDNIDPRPAGARCPACGGELQYRNRTAAERLEPECAQCGETTTLEEAARAAAARGAEPGPRPLQRVRPVPTKSAPGASLGSVFVAGLITGALAGFFMRRR